MKEFKGSKKIIRNRREIRNKRGIDQIENWILVSKKKEKRGYGEIGRRYGLDWIEPWYGNLLSVNFQIQRNPGIKNGQSWAKSLVWENYIYINSNKKR